MNTSRLARLFGVAACMLLAAALLVVAMPHLAHAATVAGDALSSSPHSFGGLSRLGIVGIGLGTAAVVQSEQRSMAGNSLATASPFVGILPPELLARPKSLYVVPLDVLALAAAGTGTAEFTADINHDYVFYYGTYRARAVADGAVVANPALLVDMQQNGGQEYNPNDKPVDIDNVLGTASQPSVWGIPMIVPAGQVLKVRVTSAHGAALNVRIGLVGFRCARAQR